jgi:hypothetical protein
MARKKHDLPGWFPFAIAAAAATALFAGARSGWRLSGDQPKTEPPPPQGVNDWHGVGAFS